MIPQKVYNRWLDICEFRCVWGGEIPPVCGLGEDISKQITRLLLVLSQFETATIESNEGYHHFVGVLRWWQSLTIYSCTNAPWVALYQIEQSGSKVKVNGG